MNNIELGKDQDRQITFALIGLHLAQIFCIFRVENGLAARDERPELITLVVGVALLVQGEVEIGHEIAGLIAVVFERDGETPQLPPLQRLA